MLRRSFPVERRATAGFEALVAFLAFALDFAFTAIFDLKILVGFATTG